MQLSEEYVARHDLNVPLVMHTKKGVFFRRRETKSKIRWQLIQIQWVEENYRPGFYQFSIMRPIHNAKRGLFQSVDSPHRITWDKYDDTLINMAKNKDYEIITTPDRATLVAWEIFVFSNDKSLSGCVESDLLFSTIDPELSIEQRYKNYQETSAYLGNFHPECLVRWRREMMGYLKEYCSWLHNFVRSVNGC